MKFHVQQLEKHRKNQARITKITTSHGCITTPAFMPVGTRAAVNCMTPEELKAAGSQIILGGNTYHMLEAPGLECIQRHGGMHPLMNWSGPMLTDSGGFQVFSLSKNSDICCIDEDGAHFKFPHSTQTIHLNPESSLHTQKIIGADIIMAFDQCTPDTTDKNVAIHAMERTHRWLKRSIEFHEKNLHSAYGYPQALFGIIQGGIFRDLREQSTDFILQQPLDGIAIGGETIGFDPIKTAEILDWIVPLLPENKTRYTMGVGLHPQDLIDVSARGIDIYDCVAPTRNARHGSLYCGRIVAEDDWIRFENTEEDGKVAIKKQRYATDERPIMEDCKCYTCQNYSRAHLHDLLKQKSIAYTTLACIHNIHVMHDVCYAMQQSIMLHSTLRRCV
jgi:queuine tRNA-ribosyltransferase